MKRKISLTAALLLCAGCAALGAAAALIWAGSLISPPKAPSVPTEQQTTAETSESTAAETTEAPTEAETEAETENPAIEDNGLPKDKLYTTEARESYADSSMRLIIPKLSVDIPVLDGTDADTLLKGVGLYEYAQLPGEGGANVSIAGHRNGRRGGVVTDNMPFFYINTLTEGDYLYLTEGGTVYQYLWQACEVIEPNDWSVIFNRGYGCVTLTTCTPIGISDHRLVVRGELVDTYPAEGAVFPSNTSEQ